MRSPEEGTGRASGTLCQCHPAARYVELNPVRAGLVPTAEDWPWSSARAHLAGRDDALAKVAPLLAIIGDWRALLDSALAEEELRDFRRHGRTGRPLGSAAFLDRLESMVGRVLRARKGGRPRKLRKLPK